MNETYQSGLMLIDFSAIRLDMTFGTNAVSYLLFIYSDRMYLHRDWDRKVKAKLCFFFVQILISHKVYRSLYGIILT